MQRILRTRTFKLAALIAVLVGAYALAGFVFAPKILRSQLIENVQKNLGVTPSVGEIRLNPFRLQLEIKDFALPDRAGAKMLGFERLFVHFDIASLWHGALMFQDIEIAAPFVHAAVARDGSLNLMQLHPKSAPPAPAATPGKSEPLPSLRIASFNVSRGLATYDDRSRETPFATRLEPIEFELQNFSTGAEGGRFTFSGFSKLGERLEWHGHLSVQPVESDGELRIEKLRAQTLWSYVEDRVAFAVNSGSVDLSANYRFSLTDTVNLSMEALKAAVTDLAIRPKGADADWIVLPSLAVDGGRVELAKHAAHVDSVILTGLKVQAWLEPDRSLNLMKLAGTTPAGSPATGTPPSPSATPPPAAAAAATPLQAAPWQFDLGEFALREANIVAEDRTTNPTTRFVFAPLSLRVTGASTNLAQSVHLALDTRINGGGALAVNGEVTPQPVAADLAIKLAKVELKALQPYLDQSTSMQLKSGQLSGDTTLRYGAAKPALAFAGNVSVEDLHTIDDALHDNFISWASLDVEGLKFQHDPDRLDIERILVRKPYARVIIESDASLNVTRVLAGPAGASRAAALEASSAAKSGASAAKSAVPAAAVKTAAVIRAPAPKKKGRSGQENVAAKASKPAAPAMPMSIRRIEVQSGLVNFSDLSIQPNFSAGIQSLKGTVTGLSTRPGARAVVDLHGEVGPFAPVSITGAVGLGGALYTDLAMDFRNIELSIFNPYSGKFAGYDIAKGKLTTELHYLVVGRALDAKHHVVIDQLEFGEKTASKDAVSLPVKLAVSLLKDRNGVIDLDLPVSGSLDDPQFKLGPLIWKIVLNLLVKAVTAPFALLGTLFGGGPDMQFVDFRPGDSALSGPAADKLKAVAKALVERPQLKLEVPIAAVPEIDRPALVEEKYRAELQQQLQAKHAGKAAKGGSGTPEFEQLDPKAQLALLTAVYAKDFGGAPKFPEPATGAKTGADLAASRVEFLANALKGHVEVGDAELQALGQQRATVLQQALLSGGQVDPARVFLVANGKAKAQDGQARLEMALQ